MNGKDASQFCPTLNIKDIQVKRIISTKVLRIKFLQAALLLHDDARLNPLALCLAMVKEAEKAGVSIVENCSINTLKVNDDGLVYGAETDCGYVECKHFVNTAGFVSLHCAQLHNFTNSLKINF